MNQIELIKGDLTKELTEKFMASELICIDTETMGLNHLRDRLCLVQMCNEDNQPILLQITHKNTPNLKKVLENKTSIKLFHFARFDVMMLKHELDIQVQNIYCTKIASKIVRTYTDKHGLKNLVSELLEIEMDKTSQTTDWGRADLSPKQMEYAAGDVIYLTKLREKLNVMLERENRMELAQKCFDFLPTIVELDLKGWSENIFSH